MFDFLKKFILLSLSIILVCFLMGQASVFIDAWLDLSDTPNSYTGQATKVVAVNAGETALEFVAGGAVEGTAVLSTGETGATKYLREDGDGTSSWQTPAGSGDVTSVGDCVSGACFDGTQGTTLTFNNAGGDGILLYDATNIEFSFNKSLGIGTTNPSEALDVIGNIAVSGTVDGIDIATDVAANTLKVTNVSTSLSIGTTAPTTLAITSDGGADDVVLTAANTSNAGLLSSAKYDEIVANTLKATNVSTSLGIGTTSPTTMAISSDGGADDVILTAGNTSNAGLLSSAKFDEIVANTLKTTNATHTGEVTGATTLTIADSVTVIGWELDGATALDTFYCYEDHDTPSAGFYLDLKRARDGDPTWNVSAEDVLGYIDYSGYYGAYVKSARIKAIVDNTPGASDMPGRLEFATSADGSGTPTTRMTIKSTGYVGIGTTDPTTALQVVGTITGDVTGALTGNADTVTTNANLTGEVTSVGNAATIADSVAVTSWNLTTPTITTSLTTSTPTTLSAAELDRLDGLTSVIIDDDKIDTFSELDAIVVDKALVNKADGAVWLGVHDYGGVTTMEIWNTNADATLAVAGQMHFNTTDEQLSFHSGADGKILGEASLSLLRHITGAIDPAGWYDQETTYRTVPIAYLGDDTPEGITIVGWKVNYVGGDPTTELDCDLMCDTTPDFNPATNATVMDVLDTTAGASSADTGFDSATCANGSRLYLRFGADPNDAHVVVAIDIWFYNLES